MMLDEAFKQFESLGNEKGCTSPFAPIWINEMVKRKG